ncbi:MAG: hydroxyacid-oxoacid transhydrogenase [Promethearchaeota archaeon]
MESLEDRIWDFRITRAKFGMGSISEIGSDIRSLGGKSVLIITDPNIVKAGLTDKIKDHLEEGNLEVSTWSEAEPEPSLESMEKGIEYARDIQVDCFIGVGGGSSIDTQKVINLVSTHGGEILDYIAPPTGGGKNVPGPVKPSIAVPTTSGTGSETTATAVISMPELKLKAGISNSHLIPSLAILDPLMAVTCPPSVTASSGLDALSHAIGAYTTRRFDCKPKPKTPMDRPIYGGRTELTDIFAYKSIELIGKYLRRAVYNGFDIKARAKMQLAAFYAGAAFGNAGLIFDHAMAYPVGGELHTPHGITTAVLLPATMDYCLPGNHEKFAIVAKQLGENVNGISVVEAAERSVIAVKKLSKDIGIPNGLEALGANEEYISRFAKDTLKIQRLLVGSPRSPNEEDLVNILKSAMRNY